MTHLPQSLNFITALADLLVSPAMILAILLAPGAAAAPKSAIPGEKALPVLSAA